MIADRNTIYTLSETELLTGRDTAPGRVRTFLLEPGKKTAPHSCTLFVWQDNFAELLRFVTIALKGGAGVKVIFPENTLLSGSSAPTLQWGVTIDKAHPEHDRIACSENFVWIDETLEAFTGAEILEYFPIESKYVVADSIEDPTGIIDSWIAMYVAKMAGEPIVFDLSALRPIDSVNSQGLVASGVKSFYHLYVQIANYLNNRDIFSLLVLLGQINDTMRRGGYKRGIITSEMDYRCPYINDYLAASTTLIPGSHKKGVTIDKGILQPEYTQLLDRIVESRNHESTFIGKVTAQGIHHNVCMGIQLADRGTCTIWRINLGLCAIEDLVQTFIDATLKICELHVSWRDRVTGANDLYAPIAEDRQVGLDVMGLANLLKRYSITYRQFIEDLESSLNGEGIVDSPNWNDRGNLIGGLMLAYQQSVKVADRFMVDRGLPLLDRIHTVEPAQSHAYECLDYEGKTVCRGIFPPQGRVVLRKSNSQLNKRYFHGDVETIAAIGPVAFERLCNLWQRLMAASGRSHSISQDTYRVCTPDRVREFLRSPSKTWYYSEHKNLDQYTFLGKKASTAKSHRSQKPTQVSCSIIPGENCSSCEE